MKLKSTESRVTTHRRNDNPSDNGEKFTNSVNEIIQLSVPKEEIDEQLQRFYQQNTSIYVSTENKYFNLYILLMKYRIVSASKSLYMLNLR